MSDKDLLEQKKAAVQGRPPEVGIVGKLVFGVFAIVVMLVAYKFSVAGFTDDEKDPKLLQRKALAAATSETVVDGKASYPAGMFDDGKAKWFTHKMADGIEVRYFILKSSDGVIRAAFDACDACWRSGKGYKQEGDELVCGNCNMRFASNKVNEVSGGCNPSPLKREMVNGNVVIEVKDIEDGRKYFDLKNK